jgi:hypothetical protein
VRACDLDRVDVPVIAVNWAVLGYRQAPVHVISNMTLILKHRDGTLPDLSPYAKQRFAGKPIKGAHTPKVIMKYAGKRHLQAGLRIPRLPDNYDVFKHGWVFAGGGPCALQIARSLGYNDVVYIGLDLLHGKDFHFYSSESKIPHGQKNISQYSGYSNTMLDMAWKIQTEYFRQVRPQMEDAGIRIRNTGLAPVFERVPFDEVFGG